MVGRLVLIATPIGNLEDLSSRAVYALANADVVACEDTRRTGKLLAHAGVMGTQLKVVNERTEAAQATEIAALVSAGKAVALVTDAGTPAISDPGAKVVEAVLAANGHVETVPGPSAVLAALVVSGLGTGRFCFEGFIPRKGRNRSERLAALSREPRTMVLFEAPHRLVRTLEDLAEVLGEDRRIAIVREQTKLHEEIWRGNLGDAVQFGCNTEPRGEYVLVVAGCDGPSSPSASRIKVALREQLASGLSRRDAAAAVAADLSISRRVAYQLSLADDEE
ncbi:MAG: 16S rRNA (cytidine(1402)-2'-O)-methyltransferase [Acidimicrobiia bacterium]|nr:16S rRNA (cytidine(1402)-2'-O)-methyltransferase [Acidimicrobiia bacterium]MYC57867.1 16S rRNA (cytidine(1402)-2'-O)-methyltransferase [Acidimicrobiia bacterium]MYG93426.1 16S rRNA (cytidine(1402)-2'-O)-methyltransferase [Acidimicrobiia bacterium]MYI31182.1 16S rRNA (cytidine(1402)-2'-O)-methyltransferase [Acidimicrobiia bacterium]